jgi:hypothetical protein
MELLVAMAPKIMGSFQEDTGRFIFGGENGGWGVTNQDVIYPLAVLYKVRDQRNVYCGNKKILDMALLGGDCIRNFQYEDGRVEFLKTDGSRWGPVYMPWTMYHWLETYNLLLTDLGDCRAEEWRRGLILAMDGIRNELSKASVHNITAWNGMSLYRAGQIFKREDYLKAGKEAIYRVVKGQDPRGFWPEHGGPTTHYNLVYMHAIGLYYYFSLDESVLESLKKSLDFQICFTYPDGVPVETIDGRVKYSPNISLMALPAFCLFPKGRRYARFLLEKSLERLESAKWSPDVYSAPLIASAYMNTSSGEEENTLLDSEKYVVNFDKVALVRRSGKWFYCLSAFTAKPTLNRWSMDRQNHFSLWHKDAGLIVGGGNSKNQPEFSNFIVSEDGKTIFIAESAEVISSSNGDVLSLKYGETTCFIQPTIMDDQEAAINYAIKKLFDKEVTVRYNLILRVQPGEILRTATGFERELSEEKIELRYEEIGEWISNGNWFLYLPLNANLLWPIKPFNPYKMDGSSPLKSAACIVWGDVTSMSKITFKIKVINR